jgi:hypothetical protein
MGPEIVMMSQMKQFISAITQGMLAVFCKKVLSYLLMSEDTT